MKSSSIAACGAPCPPGGGAQHRYAIPWSGSHHLKKGIMSKWFHILSKVSSMNETLQVLAIQTISASIQQNLLSSEYLKLLSFHSIFIFISIYGYIFVFIPGLQRRRSSPLPLLTMPSSCGSSRSIRICHRRGLRARSSATNSKLTKCIPAICWFSRSFFGLILLALDLFDLFLLFQLFLSPFPSGKFSRHQHVPGYTDALGPQRLTLSPQEGHWTKGFFRCSNERNSIAPRHSQWCPVGAYSWVRSASCTCPRSKSKILNYVSSREIDKRTRLSWHRKAYP